MVAEGACPPDHELRQMGQRRFGDAHGATHRRASQRDARRQRGHRPNGRANDANHRSVAVARDPAEELARGRKTGRDRGASYGDARYRGCRGSRGRPRGRTKGWSRTARPNAYRRAVERHLDRPVGIGSIGLARELVQSLDRRRRRMAVRVAEAGRHDSDGRPDGLQEWARARRLRAVMCNLQEVDLREAAGEELRIDALLDVTGEQEAV